MLSTTLMQLHVSIIRQDNRKECYSAYFPVLKSYIAWIAKCSLRKLTTFQPNNLLVTMLLLMHEDSDLHQE